MTEIITIAEDHSVSYSSGAFVLNLTIDNQNAVDRIEFVLPESVGNPADWAWRVEISQNGETSWVALADDVVWIPRAGAVTYGKCELQLVGVQPAEDGSYNRVWKSRVFKANVLESINAIVDAEQASELDDIVLKVEGYKDAAEASAQAAASSASAAQAAQTEAEAAQDAAEDAQSAAETAQGKAEAAQTAAETAQSSAETARTQAQAAQNAAETAQGKAEDAQEAAEAAQAAAEGAAEDLSAAVASAAQSASSAAQSATDASGYASAASSSATAAAGSATTAQGHASAAQTARAGAESAQSAAETAQGLAEDAQEAAEFARNAAQSAQSAAESAKSSAEAAKSGAETAKTAAETAAGNASDDADTAASNASAAAQSAETAQAAAQTALGIIDDATIANDSTWSSERISGLLSGATLPTGRFGVSGVGQSAPALTRLWDAVGMTATPSTDTVAGSSDFDDYAPFSRRKCVGSWSLVDGKAKFAVSAYESDADYAEDGTMGNYVAVDVTPFYYLDQDGVLGVSAQQYPGWSIHPVCKDYDGNIRPHTYLPCYQVGLKDGVPVSLPGYYPENGSYAQLITKLRAYSADLADHVMLEPSAVNHYEWLLFTIEYATQNCQSIMQGAANMRHSTDLIVSVPGANQIIMQWSHASNFVLGQTVGFTTNVWDNPTPSVSYRQITAMQRCDEDSTVNESGSYCLITYNGADKSADISIGTTYCTSRPWICGATQGYAPGVSAVLGHTGAPVNLTNGKYPCLYRHRENLWGNQYMTSMDLFDVRVGEGDDVYHLDWYFMHDPRLWMPYATTNPDLDDLNDPTHGFTKLDVATPSSSYANGYIVEEDADSDYPWVRVPVNTTVGSSSAYTCDYAYLVNSDVVRSVRRGGPLYNGSYVGLRFVLASNAPSSGYWHYGGALYFQ